MREREREKMRERERGGCDDNVVIVTMGMMMK